MAEHIFGKDVATQKGKSTRPRLPSVIEDYIKIPKEIKTQYKNISLCINIMYINLIPIFISIDKSKRFRNLVPLANQKSSKFVTTCYSTSFNQSFNLGALLYYGMEESLRPPGYEIHFEWVQWIMAHIANPLINMANVASVSYRNGEYCTAR